MDSFLVDDSSEHQKQNRADKNLLLQKEVIMNTAVF